MIDLPVSDQHFIENTDEDGTISEETLPCTMVQGTLYYGTPPCTTVQGTLYHGTG